MLFDNPSEERPGFLEGERELAPASGSTRRNAISLRGAARLSPQPSKARRRRRRQRVSPKERERRDEPTTRTTTRMEARGGHCGCCGGGGHGPAISRVERHSHNSHP